MNDTDIRRPPYRPLFLVFDGMDGSGKTTQMNLLADRLRAEGVPVAVTAEPTASPDGKAPQAGAFGCCRSRRRGVGNAFPAGSHRA